MNSSDTQTLIIVLATVVPVALAGVVGCFLYRRSRQRRRRFLFKRGITPIDDNEVETWKTAKSAERISVLESTSEHDLELGHHQQKHDEKHQQHDQPQQQRLRQKSTSFSSIRKPQSVIIYQHNQNPQHPHPRVSDELSPRSLHHKRSIDMPPAAALARAPNSRPGLTDDMIQGDDAFISPMKRQPARLAKPPPSARHSRSRASHSSTVSAFSPQDPWQGHYPDLFNEARESSDYLPRAGQSLDIRHQHRRMHSTMTDPCRISFDDEVSVGGLSPRPLIRKSEIGMAIG